MDYITQHPNFTYISELAIGFIMNDSLNHFIKCKMHADDELIYIATSTYSIKCLCYLFSMFPTNYKFREDILEVACIIGDIEVIYILLENGCIPTERAIYYAKSREHNTIVESMMKILNFF